MEYTFKNKKYEIGKLTTKKEHSNSIKKIQDELKDYLILKNSNMTSYTKTNNIEFSKGCQACQSGNWLCIFVGNKCNETCKFCPRKKDKTTLNYGNKSDEVIGFKINDMKEIIDGNHNNIKGISYSGGEPFIYINKVLKISKYAKNKYPTIYQWVYTNGKLMNEDNLKKLKNTGINEIRVDLAATNFDDKIVNKLKLCADIMERVTVEVPMIPEVYIKLIKEKYLHKLVNNGVQQLNLAELMLVQDINFITYGINNEIYEHITKIGKKMISPAGSRKLTYKVIKYAIKNNLNILINDCSNDTKQIQINQRDKTKFKF